MGLVALREIRLMQLNVVRTLQCLVKGEALVSLCPGHNVMPSSEMARAIWTQCTPSSMGSGDPQI